MSDKPRRPPLGRGGAGAPPLPLFLLENGPARDPEAEHADEVQRGSHHNHGERYASVVEPVRRTQLEHRERQRVAGERVDEHPELAHPTWRQMKL